jgi:hypothetical protein
MVKDTYFHAREKNPPFEGRFANDSPFRCTQVQDQSVLALDLKGNERVFKFAFWDLEEVRP